MQAEHLYLEKVTKTLRITLDQLRYSRMYLKSLRDAYFINYPILWVNFYENTNVVFAKASAYKIVY